MELGYCNALIARELPDGRLQLIDGHLRKDVTPDTIVPVLVVDVTEAEADKLLVTLDPLACLAEADVEALHRLLASVDSDDAAVQNLWADLAAGELTPFPPSVPMTGLIDPDQIPDPPDGRSHSSEIYGSWESIVYSAATAPTLGTWTDCSMANRFTWSTPTRRTTSRCSRAATMPSLPATVLSDHIKSKVITTGSTWRGMPEREGDS